MKKLFTTFLAASLLVAGCSQPAKTEKGLGTQKDGYTILKVGVTAGDTDVWEVVNQNLEKAGDKIKIEKVIFDDYVQPNLALANHDIDLNAFQHVIYFEDFKSKHK